MLTINKIHHGDALTLAKQLQDESVNCIVTSPPYWALRDYGCNGQLGLESTFKEYVEKLCTIFDELKRVLKKDGTCWIVLGDTYFGNGQDSGKRDVGVAPINNLGTQNKANNYQNKSLCLIPHRFAMAMVDRGWILRADIVWNKPNPLPESVKDRPTKSHEYIFFFVKNKQYYYNAESIKTPTKGNEHDKRARISRKRFPTKLINGIRKTGYYPMANKKSVWTVNTKAFPEAHFAVFPETLIVPMIKAGCPKDGIVLDPFIGAGTTALVALKLQRQFIAFELNEDYIEMAKKRLKVIQSQPQFAL